MKLGHITEYHKTMIGLKSSVVVVGAVLATLITAAPQSTLQVVGRCYSNTTHWCDDRYCTKLPSCWVAICDNDAGTVTVGTPCTAGPDISYSLEELKPLVYYKHCYPAARGELPGNQCCGGHLICAHWGKNRYKFDIKIFLDVLEDLKKGEFTHY